MTAGRRLKPGYEELPLERAEETVLAGSTMPYRDWLMAPDPEDPVWQPMRLGQALERVSVPVLLQEGWQDRFVGQMTEQYERLRDRGVDVGLTIGPWTHVELVHRTNNPHVDLFVRLCEVGKKGRSVNLSDAMQRLEPEKSTGTIRLQLDAMAHRFNPGTRVRLQISGGAHPRYARNLGTDEDPATSVHLVPSHRTICHGDGGYSRVFLPCPR